MRHFTESLSINRHYRSCFINSITASLGMQLPFHQPPTFIMHVFLSIIFYDYHNQHIDSALEGVPTWIERCHFKYFSIKLKFTLTSHHTGSKNIAIICVMCLQNVPLPCILLQQSLVMCILWGQNILLWFLLFVLTKLAIKVSI